MGLEKANIADPRVISVGYPTGTRWSEAYEIVAFMLPWPPRPRPIDLPELPQVRARLVLVIRPVDSGEIPQRPPASSIDHAAMCANSRVCQLTDWLALNEQTTRRPNSAGEVVSPRRDPKLRGVVAV